LRRRKSFKGLSHKKNNGVNMAIDKRYTALGEANKVLKEVVDKIDEGLTRLEPYNLPTIKGALKSAKHELSFVRSATVIRRSILRGKKYM